MDLTSRRDSFYNGYIILLSVSSALGSNWKLLKYDGKHKNHDSINAGFAKIIT